MFPYLVYDEILLYNFHRDKSNANSPVVYCTLCQIKNDWEKDTKIKRNSEFQKFRKEQASSPVQSLQQKQNTVLFFCFTSNRMFHVSSS